jgi:VCBS repeat-containing protein
MRTTYRGALRSLLTVVSAFALSCVAVTAQSAPGGAGGGGGKVSCSINDPGAITVGVLTAFSATITSSKTYTVQWTFPNATPASSTDLSPSVTFGAGAIGNQTVSLVVTQDSNGKNPKTGSCSLQVSVAAVGGKPTARGDTYGTPVGKKLVVQLSRVSGVLYNDFDTDVVTGKPIGNAGLTAVLDSGPAHGTLNLNANGSFTYTPDGSQGQNENDGFTYHAVDGDGNSSNVAKVNIHIESDQPDFKIMMNYELGMHCTGFEFSYCCVLPPYNSILAQIVKPQSPGFPQTNADFPRLLTADPNNGLDGLGRERVLRDYDADGTIHKYFLEYFHDAQPRREGNSPGVQSSTLISDIEGKSMLYWNTPYDSAMVDATGSITGVPGKLVTGTYAGLNNVVLGNGDYTDPTDNFANGWLNHFYIYADLEGTDPGGTSLERDKIRLGVTPQGTMKGVVYPANSGAALQPMGPTGNGTPFENDLTFSGDTGTIVYTQMKVLENLPIMLTAPRIWEALGLPLDPFEDTINFFADPGAVDEDKIRPYVAMKAQLFDASCDENTGDCTKGAAVIGSNGQPVIGFGTAPIDIPNCERCHSAPAYQADGVTPNVNSPSYVRRQNGPKPYNGPNGETLEAVVDEEINYWKAYYNIDTAAGDTDWYPRLKGAAISIEAMHDYDNGTNFMANWPVAEGDNPLGLPPSKAAIVQNTRMGHESVICQKCHADNVIAVVKSAGIGGFLVPPISEAIHNTHRSQSEGGVIVMNDGLGRDGGCQGCHPAHRSDGVMDGYPIAKNGASGNIGGDNRLNQGGCFVGRDVHSNPLKDVDGAETPAHLNAVGQWLADNVFYNQGGLPGSSGTPTRGIWCTNCHTQLGQEMWRKEDCNDLIHGDCVNNIRGQSLQGIANQVAGGNLNQVIAWLDPNNQDLHGTGLGDFTHAIWNENPDYPDANVATIEVAAANAPGNCAPLTPVFNAAFNVNVCVSLDGDGDPSVNILSFCTTDDCVAKINANKGDQSKWRYPANPFKGTGTLGAAVPFQAADDARDHWLAAGEPHCADCHAAPYVEQSGNITFFPPFNYPAKASLMRYTRGHQDISCQGCHESIHGLYPVSPAIDTTSYAQAAALNADGSHGPLKCGTCHQVDSNGIPTWIDGQLSGGGAVGGPIGGSFDNAVGWAHTYTAEANVLNTTCQNCHGVNGVFGSSAVNTSSTPAQWTKVASHTEVFLKHAMNGFTSRQMMDKAETLVNGAVTQPSDGLCTACHEGNADNTTVLHDEGCNLDNEPTWMEHLSQGRVAESVWENVSLTETGTRCGW